MTTGTAERGALPGGTARLEGLVTPPVLIRVEIGWLAEDTPSVLDRGAGDDADGDKDAGPTSEGDSAVVVEGVG